MEHESVVHDAQLDYFGRYLATCSSDHVVKLFEVQDNGKTHICDLHGHEGPVWQVAWAHPNFGSILASCSYDRRVIIWRENISRQWDRVFESRFHQLSVNAIAWAPPEHGLCLACASSDGKVSLLSFDEGQQLWGESSLTQADEIAHKIGVNAVSWAPANIKEPTLISNNSKTTNNSVRYLATAGCDGMVRLWRAEGQATQWQQEAPLSLKEAIAAGSSSSSSSSVQHSASAPGWVRDVQWAPNIGSPVATLAACSESGYVVVWNRGEQGWEKPAVLHNFREPVWRLSWSTTGNLLAVSSGDARVSLWKEGIDGKWTCVNQNVLQTKAK